MNTALNLLLVSDTAVVKAVLSRLRRAFIRTQYSVVGGSTGFCRGLSKISMDPSSSDSESIQRSKQDYDSIMGSLQ